MPRRESEYPVRLSLNISPEMMDALQKAGERYDVAVGVLARDALRLGMKGAIDKARREAARLASIEARKEKAKRRKS